PPRPTATRADVPGVASRTGRGTGTFGRVAFPRSTGLCSAPAVRFVLALAVALRLAVPAFAAGEAPEQTVTAIEPQGEQRVEPVPPPPEQEVAALDPPGEQQVTSGQKGGVRRGFGTAGEAARGGRAAGVSVGVMLAELILL